MFPEVVVATHATPKAADFFHSFFSRQEPTQPRRDRHQGRLAFRRRVGATMLTAADRFPTDFKEGTQPLEKQNHFDWGSRGSFEFRIYC